MKKAVVCLIAFALLAATAFAGGAGEAKKPAKIHELRFMLPTLPGDAAYDILKEKAEAFEKANPNVKVIIDSQPSAQMRTKLTVEYAAGNPPSVSWSPLNYTREFMKDNKIVDLRPIYDDPKNPEFKQWYSETALLGSADSDGRLMAVPHEASMDGLFYNKEIFDKFGWDLPKTFDDMLALAKKAREKGIFLMVTGGKDMRFAWFASGLLVRTTSLEKANQLALGPALDKWNDPSYGFIPAMRKFNELVKAQAYPPGVLGFSANDADQFFARGEAAMYYEGAWKPGNWAAVGGDEFIRKVHRMDLPPMTDMPGATPGINIGGTIVGYIVAANQTPEEIENCVKWLKVVVDPGFWKEVVKRSGRMQYLPAGRIGDFDWSPYPAVNKELYDAFQKAKGFAPSMDTWAPPAVDLAIKKTAMPGIVAGEYTVEQAVAEVQKASEEYLKTLKK
jgi:raffinose/stachyose/melibiose transport system substrate-binding protein